MLAPAGTIIDGQFEVLSTIGMGGYGVVYKARQMQLDRIVALKMLNTSVDVDTDIQQRFERESHALSSLKHRNLVMVYGAGFWKGRPYMSMEFVQGISLQRVIEEEGRLELKRAIRLVRQLLDGLSCAHANGIVHRDLKPSNVMILQRGPEELVKIIDFGLAKVLPGAGFSVQKVTEAGYAVGSVMYMSPEQCLAQEEVYHRSDIYAIGCILHSCLTGTHPYGGEHSAIVMMQHVQATPRLLSQCLPEDSFPPELQWVLNKALAKPQEERYQTAEAMSSDLLLIASDRSGEVSCQGAEVPQGANAPEPEKKGVSPLWAAIIGSLLTIFVVVTVSRFQSGGGASGLSSSELFNRGQAILSGEHGDPEQAVPLFEQALDKAQKDGLLESVNAAQACCEICGYYGISHPERTIAFANEGLRYENEAHRPVSDKTMLLAMWLLRASNADCRPSDALPTCEKLLTKRDSSMSGVFQYHLRQTMAEAHAMMGRPMKAKDLLDECANVQTPEEEGGGFRANEAYVRGQIAFLQENYKEAIAEFEKTKDHAYCNGKSLNGLALSWIALGEWRKAQDCAEEFGARHGGRVDNAVVVALLDAHDGKWPKARAQLQQVCSQCEEKPDMFKGVQVEFALDQFMQLAKKQDKSAMLSWSADWFARLHSQYLRHMHIFKQSNIHDV